MKPRPFDFKTQQQIGQQGELFLDQWLSPSYQIKDVSQEKVYQRSGIDRLVTRNDGSVLTVEYKVDKVARRTRNLFFETMSNDQNEVPGWGWSSKADYWIFLIPEQEILVFKPARLRALAWTLHQSLQRRTVKNQGYCTVGYPIPLEKARAVTSQRQALYLDRL